MPPPTALPWWVDHINVSRQHSRSTKNAQTMFHTIIWASDMPTTSATSPRWPLITTIDDEWGLETHLEPSCMFFSCFISFFFYTNMNFLLNRLHHHQQDDINVSTTSMHQDGILTGLLRVPRHHDGHKSPPWTTNGGLRQFSSPPCMFFFPFFKNFSILTWIF